MNTCLDMYRDVTTLEIMYCIHNDLLFVKWIVISLLYLSIRSKLKAIKIKLMKRLRNKLKHREVRSRS